MEKYSILSIFHKSTPLLSAKSSAKPGARGMTKEKLA